MTLAECVQTTYALALGQCTDVMQQRLEALPTFDNLCNLGDGIGLLKEIQAMLYNFASQKYLAHALIDSKKRYYGLYQGKDLMVHRPSCHPTM